jgi:pyruvate/2-oxoglutarate dehydrogenase complex dihydrolipoamide acyltransferase (E2) component
MAERVFALPDLGEGLEEAEIVAWLVAAGETVALNQPLVEVETAKATVEIPSPFAGVVTTLHGAPGEAVSVGSPLVTFDGADGGVASDGSPGSPEAGGRAIEGVRATPPVRKLAKELGVDLATVIPTGDGGRITADDVRAAAGGDADLGARSSRARRAIAGNLVKQAAIPQVTVFRTVDCSALEARRGELGVSPLPMVIAALTQTVGAHPAINARWTDEGVEDRSGVHVGLAVDTERGLVVTVLRDAEGRGIDDLASEIKRLADGARSGTSTPQEMAGATVAVSNTGSYGSEAGTPILSPGTSITLAIGVIAPRALVVDGEVVARPACTLSCTFDHRVLDGATVGRALTDLVNLLENAAALGDLPV